MLGLGVLITSCVTGYVGVSILQKFKETPRTGSLIQVLKDADQGASDSNFNSSNKTSIRTSLENAWQKQVSGTDVYDRIVTQLQNYHLLPSLKRKDHTESEDYMAEFVDKGFAIATMAFGTAIGSLLYPPLGLISTASMFYLTLNVWQVVWYDLVKKHKVTNVAVEGVFLPGVILSGHLVAAGFCFWAFYWYTNLIVHLKGRSFKKMTNIFGEQIESIWVRKDGVEIEVPFQTIQAGDVVVIHAGEKIPVDGTIIEGVAALDQRMLTGESQPVEKSEGESVFAGTILLSGHICVHAEKTGSDTLVSQIGDILENTTVYAEALELRSVEMANRLALPHLITGALAYPVAGPLGSLAVLWSPLYDVLYMSGPLSLFNYLSIASDEGILIKDARAFELLEGIDTFVFDKTGTLTTETPQVKSIYTCNDWKKYQIIAFAAAAETKQSHPIAQAILNYAQAEQIDVPPVKEVTYEVGYGLKVWIDNQMVLVGSERFMAQEGILIPDPIKTVQGECHAMGHALVYVAIDNQLGGAIELEATIRPEVPAIVAALKNRGYNLYIISGDHEEPTQKLAQQIGIDHYFAETLPEQKSNLIGLLQAEGKSVCFIGDGINDAIALKKSQVSISLSGASTVATDTAQIVLMDGSLNQLIFLLDMAEGLDNSLKRSLIAAWLPTLICVSGVFFLNFGLNASIFLYAVGLTSGFINAMWPKLKGI